MSKKIKALELTALRDSLGAAKDYVILEPVKCDAAADCVIEVDARGKWDVIPAAKPADKKPAKPDDKKPAKPDDKKPAK